MKRHATARRVITRCLPVGLAVVVLTALVPMASALAQQAQQATLVTDHAWPARPVRMVIPFPPGGGADGAARLLVAHLSQALGQPFIVDSKPGGSTLIATTAVAKAAPDGYTLLMTSGSTFTLQPLLNEKLPFDPDGDFAPVAMLSQFPFHVVASSTLEVNTLSEAITIARNKPGEVAYASNGRGGSVHVGMEYLAHAAGIRLNHVAYKGFPAAMPDLVAGRVSLILADMGPIAPHVQSGALKLLAVTSPERWPLTPDVPTVAEQGLPGYALSIWFAVFAPAGTPPAIVERLSRTMQQWLATEPARAAYAAIGHAPASGGADEVRERIAAERRAFKPILREAGLLRD